MINFKQMIIPTLNILSNHKEGRTIKEIDELLIEKLEIQDSKLDKLHEDTRQTEFSYQSAWARTYLRKYGLISNPDRGFWKINPIYNGEELNAATIICGVRNRQVFMPKEEEGTVDLAENNEKYIEALSQVYSDNKITLFLGAGVSMAANLPSWSELVAKFLMERIYDGEKDQFESKKIMELAKLNCENSQISQTRFIKQNMEPERYLKLLKESIYLNDVDINFDNELFKSLVKLIRDDNQIRIKNIIDFNFDNLFEQKLDQADISFQNHINYDTEQNQDKVNIYHVHGYINQNDTPDEVDLDRIIFSEEQYHKMYNDVYNWSNIKQINALREKTCLFIGCSLSDPNMRRLLDIAHDEKKNHYAIMKKEVIKKPDTMDSKDSAYMKYQRFHLENRNAYFKSLGINIIWVDEFEDIPKIIKTIKLKKRTS